MKSVFPGLLAALFMVFAGGCGKPAGSPNGGNAAPAATRQVVVKVPAMHCSSCVGTIRAALRKVDGVKSSQFDLEKKLVTIEVAAPQAGTPAVEAAIEAAITGADFEVEKAP